MFVQLHKNSSGEGTLTCLRPDGTRTWWKLSEFFGLHDLVHYVVESTLGYTGAFFGLIAAGWEQDWFGKVDPQTGRKREVPAEAGVTEFIVAQLQTELFTGQPEADFWPLLTLACDAFGLSPPIITDAQLGRMRAEVRRLTMQWQQTPPGGTLELRFAPQES